MSLREQITSDLAASMRAKDTVRTSTLRMVKSALMNREIEKGGPLADEEFIQLLQSLVKQRRDSVEQYEKGGRPELARKELDEITIIERYLPRAASREEIEQAVASAMIETGAGSMRDMGKVMQAVKARLHDRTLDGKLASEIVRYRLSH